jgi:ABC-type transporter Mla MlaB component
MSDVTSVDFGEILDISFAAKFHSQLKDDVQINSSIRFLTSELTRIDTSCLQVLVSFMEYAKENKISIEWDAPGDVIKEAARLTGLTTSLELAN